MAVTPTPERQARTAFPNVAPQLMLESFWRPGTGVPLSTTRARFWRTDTTSGPMTASLPHLATVGAPLARMTSEAAPSTRGLAKRPSA